MLKHVDQDALACCQAHCGQLRHAQIERRLCEPHKILAHHNRFVARHLVLTQPAQTPVALHTLLEFGIRSIACIEGRDHGEQIGIASSMRWRLTQGDRNQLTLIEQIDVAAQR